MTCNFVNHERELLEAFDKICTSSGQDWYVVLTDSQNNHFLSILRTHKTAIFALYNLVVKSFVSSNIELQNVSQMSETNDGWVYPPNVCFTS
jgi:hypothetical protein